MSFNASSYIDEDYYRSIGIAEVATGKPTILKEWGGTNVEDYTFVKTWTVRGLKALDEGRGKIVSAPFTHQNYSKWCMALRKKMDGLYMCFLLKKSEPELLVRAKLTAYEILPNGEKREIFPVKWFDLEEGKESGDFLVRNAGAEVQDNSEDEITLQGEVCMQCVVHDELPAVADTAELQNDIVRAVDEMLHSEVLTDFELHAGGTVLKAHRALLSVRSPYFAAMLQPHTKEAKEGSVEVKDVKPEVLKQVLAYVYTAKPTALKDMPWELLIAADKYQLQQLKRQCEAHIASSLNVDNAAETAANASLFSCDLLWDRAVVFIKRNLFEVMRTPGWAMAISAHPEAIQRISELMG